MMLPFVSERPRSVMLFLMGAFALAAFAPVVSAEPLDPPLVGNWYWEKTTYVSAGDYSTLIKSTRTLTLRPDGTFRYVEAGTHVATKTYSGTVRREGNQLVFTDASGRSLTFAFELRGSNGLIVGGVLYERR